MAKGNTSVPGNDNSKYDSPSAGSVLLGPMNQEPYPGGSQAAFPVEAKTTDGGAMKDPLGIVHLSKGK